MTSFLSRIANEATAALSDAYGHVMHGDDAGSSARLVWVVHPTRVSIDTDKINGVRECRYTQKFGELFIGRYLLVSYVDVSVIVVDAVHTTRVLLLRFHQWVFSISCVNY